MPVRAYDEVYLGDIMSHVGHSFLKIRDDLPGVDEKWYIEMFMRSDIRRLLDEANPFWANRLPGELVLDFLAEELCGEYRRGEEWWGFLPEWAGRIYSLYQWYYNVPSALLIDMLPLSKMETVYPTLHQAGELATVEKIHDEVLGL
jgi:hypothetical protein